MTACGRVLVGVVMGAWVVACGDAPLTSSPQKQPDAAAVDGGSVTGDGGVADAGATSDTPSTDVADASACASGPKFCNGAMLYVCKPDSSGYSEVKCDRGCDSGACKGSCKANATSCKSDNVLETCDANGNPTTSTCPKYCQEGKCTDVKTICKPDELFCEPGGSQLFKCSSDGTTASALDQCPFGCDTKTVTCKAAACLANETRCAADNAKMLETCLPDQSGWKKASCPQTCEAGKCITTSCTPGEKQCGPDGVHTCGADGKTFTLETPCKQGCASVPGGEPTCVKCETGQVACNATGDGTLKCIDPATGFKPADTCTADQSCAGGKCIPRVKVAGNVPKELGYLAVMKAFVACFKAAKAGTCGSLDTSAVTYAISPDDLNGWLCGHEDELAAQFDTQGDVTVAADILGCGTFDIEDLTFYTDGSTIHSGLSGKECFAFSTSWFTASPNGKEIVVDQCVKL